MARRKRKSPVDKVLDSFRRRQRALEREVGEALSAALGFTVTVRRKRVEPPLSPDMKRARRLTKAEARKRVAASFAP